MVNLTGDADMSDESSKTESFEKTVELRLPSKLGYERIAMNAASSLASRMGFRTDRIDDLKTAISEAVTNAIEHGNQHNETMKVVVLLTARDDELFISVTDESTEQIPPETITSTPDIRTRLDPNVLDRGGWGTWLIRELVDEVEFTTAPTGGNQVRMVIHLEHPEKP